VPWLNLKKMMTGIELQFFKVSPKLVIRIARSSLTVAVASKPSPQDGD